MALFTGTILVLTQSSASAKAAVDLDQCANIGPTCDTDNPSQWQNGNLGSSNSSYREGDAVPYRTKFTGLVADSTYAVNIAWETTKGGKRALDYLTSYDYSETTADPCAGLTCAAPTSQLPIPIDPDVGAIQVGGQNFTIFGGTFPVAGSSIPNTGTLCATDPCIISSNPTPYQLSGVYTGDSKRSLTVYFTASSTSAVLAWGGHIASALDWGVGNSASTISGSPYHMILSDFDCSNDTRCSTGEQDRSLSSQAVIAPASITIVKEASLEGSTEFQFTASPSPLADFSLIDDGTITDTKVFSGIKNFTTYTISEQSLAYWDLSNVTCGVTAPNGGSQIVLGAQVTIDLQEGENVTCTYVNTSTYAPEMSLAKNAAPMTYAAAGETITYTYTLTNTGNAPLGPDQFTVTDDKINGGMPFDCGPADTTLAVDATLTCTADYTIMTSDIQEESVTNLAIGSGGGQTTASATATVLYADLSIAKSASPSRYLASGDTITYTYTLTNTGNVALGPDQFTVTDDKINGGMPFDCGPADTTLAIDATITCTANYTVTVDDIEDKSVTNLAFGNGGRQTTSNATTTVNLAALAIEKTATPQTFIAVGGSVLYTYDLTNTGNVALGPDQFTVTDDKINGGMPFDCGPADTTLAIDATITCTAVYIITADDITDGFVTNNAQGFGDGVTTSETTTTVVYANLSISKEAAPLRYSAVGQIITYSYTLTNTGNASLGPAQFTVTDDKINAGLAFPCGEPGTTLTVGTTLTCTAEYTITADDVAEGVVTNTAYGDGPGLTTPVVATSVTYAELDLDKVASPTTYTAVGEIVTYTYTVTNSGNTALGPAQFMVDDSKIDGGTPFNCGPPATTLAIGASIVCTNEYVITTADVAAGFVTNAAFAMGEGLISATTFATVSLKALSIAKSAAPTTYDAAGDTITYTYTLTNTGNASLGPAQFTVTDDKINAGLAFPCGVPGATLLAGASLTCSAIYTVTPTDVTVGSITNVAIGSGGGISSPPATATVAFVPPPTTTTTTTTLAPTTTTTTTTPAPTTTAPPEEFAVLFPLPRTGNDSASSWWLLAMALILGGALMVTARLMRRRPE